MKKRIQLALVAITVLNTLSLAQSSCEDALLKANTLFKEGNLKNAVNVLESCAESYKNNEDKFEAYKLLGIIHLELQNSEKMNEAMELMLLNKPEYQTLPNNDPAQFVKAVSKYSIYPDRFMGFEVGLSVANVKMIKGYQPLLFNSQTYQPYWGYEFGVKAMQNIPFGLKLSESLLYSGTGIGHEIYYSDGWIKKYEESIQMGQLNIGVRKVFPSVKNTFKPFLGVNGTMNYSTSNRLSISSISPDNEVLRQKSKNVNEERNRFQPGFGAFVGLEFPLKKSVVIFEGGYTLLLNNTVKESMRLSDPEFIINTQYINDDLKLRLLTFRVSYLFASSFKVDRPK